MSLKDQLNADLKEAMKAGDETRKNALRAIMAAIKQAEIDRRATQPAGLTDEDIVALLQKEVKARRESIADAEKAGRADLTAAPLADIAIYESYLPQMLNRAELEELARAAIAEAGVDNPKGLGAVMKVLSPRVKGRADGKTVNEVVRALLGG